MLRYFRYGGAVEFVIDFERARMWCGAAMPLKGVDFKKQPKAGERRYDWEGKLSIALSYSEVLLLSQAAKDAREGYLDWEANIFHDAAKSQKASVKFKKSITISQSDGTTWLNVRGGPVKVGFSLSNQELYVMEQLFAQAGYDLALSQQALDERRIEEMREAEEEEVTEEEKKLFGGLL